jgi:peroxiredoxin
MRFLWSIRILRPWLFRRWEERRRRALAATEGAGCPLAVGESVPGFALPDDVGEARRSGEFLGRSAAIVWFTNLCAVCEDQARELEALRGRGELDAGIVAIHLPGGSEPSPSEFRRRTGAKFPILIDDGSVGRAWAGEAVPDT